MLSTFSVSWQYTRPYKYPKEPYSPHPLIQVGVGPINGHAGLNYYPLYVLKLSTAEIALCMLLLHMAIGCFLGDILTTGKEQEELAREAGFRSAAHYEIAFGLMGVLVVQA